MKKGIIATAVAFLLVALGAVPSNAAITGNYIEVRSADVYTGPCFANSEVGLVGKQAILGWKIEKGAWHGTALDGLSVVAVVEANATLGDPYHSPYPAKSVLIVDQRANPAQRQALEAFAHSAAGKLLAHVVRVDVAPISLTRTGGQHAMQVELVAGKLARIQTRALCEADHLCGNEEVYYPPLTKVAHAMPAFTLEESFHGQGLNETWDRMDKRSAFIGTFTL